MSNKGARLQAIEHLLLAHLEGRNQSELAQHARGDQLQCNPAEKNQR